MKKNIFLVIYQKKNSNLGIAFFSKQTKQKNNMLDYINNINYIEGLWLWPDYLRTVIYQNASNNCDAWQMILPSLTKYEDMSEINRICDSSTC